MFSLSASSFTYDGAAHEPKVSSSVVPEVSYFVEYRDNVDAGQATAIVTGDSFYTDSCELQFTIEKANPIYDTPSALTGTYGKTLSSIALPGGFSWQGGADAKIDWYGTKTLSLIYTPTDTANYNVVRDIQIAVYVQRGNVDVPSVAPFTYAGDLQKPLLSDDPRITVLSNEGGTDAGEYTATVALAEPAFDKWTDGTVASKTITWRILPADLSVVNFDGPADCTLVNGKAEPAVSAAFNSYALQQNRDYTVSYESNTSLGSAHAIVNGLGNFTGERRFDFRIGKADISSYTPIIYDKVIAYKGQLATPRVYLQGQSGVTLHESYDYEVSYLNNNGIGTARAVLRGIGDYIGTVEGTFSIVDKIDLSSDAIRCSAEQFAFYTGEPIEQPIKIFLSGRNELVEGRDYTVRYENNVSPGYGTAIVQGIGDYTGEVQYRFSIIRKSDYNLTNAGTVYLSANRFTNGGDTFLFSGSPIEPKTSVHLKVGNSQMLLKEGVDYTVHYSGNSSIGPGYITIEGINGLSGSLVKSFRISDTLSISSLGLSSVFDLDQIDYDLSNGLPVKPKLLPYPDFVEGADYELSYKNCDKVGTGTVAITGRGRYTGSVDLPVRIVDSRSRLLLYGCSVNAIPDQVYTGESIEPEIVVQDTNGKMLDSGLEYGTSYYDNVNAGTANVLIANGAGFTTYDGYLQASFNILPANLSDTEIAPIEDQPLNAAGTEPDPEVTFNGHTLQKGIDYETSYSNNKSIGTAICKIKGKGNFAGEIEKTFNVVKPEIPHSYTLEEGEAQTLTWDNWGTTAQFTLPNGGAPYFLFTIVNGIASPTGTVLDSEGNAVYSFQFQSKNQYGAMALPAGTYYLKIEGWRGSGSVNLHYWNNPYGYSEGATYELENNAPSSQQSIPAVATSVSANGRFIGTGYAPAKISGDDIDYFAVTLSGASNLELDFTARESFMFDLVDATGETITSDSGDGYLSKMTYWGTEATIHMNCGTLEPGTYFVKVTPQTKDAIGSVYYCDVTNKPLSRLAGNEAADTSAKIAQAAFPEGSEWVVIARDDDFADAMSATGLAGALGAPIVLTSRYGLSEAAADAVYALGAKKAYIIGGKGAIPGDLEGELAAAGCQQVERVFGEESWDTSVACAEKIAEHGGNPNGDAIVAMSSNFQDALSISSFAYKYQVPIYLETSGDDRKLPSAARKAIKKLKGTVYVPGGPGAVPTDSVEGVFGEGRVQRIWGEDGYDTSNQIATYMVERGLLSTSTVCVASGAPDPKGVDALAGAALAGRAGGVMLLANDNPKFGEVDSTTIDGGDSQGAPAFLASHAGEVGQAYLLGGRAVVGSELQQKVNELLG